MSNDEEYRPLRPQSVREHDQILRLLEETQLILYEIREQVNSMANRMFRLPGRSLGSRFYGSSEEDE